MIGGAADAAPAASGRKADQAALAAYAGWVGDWRGVGQPQRSSRKGAWTESAHWVWKLSADSAALDLAISEGKYVRSALLKPGREPGSFVLDATLADGSKRSFRGEAGPHDRLALTTDDPEAQGVGRITLTPLHDTRFLILLERRVPESERFERIAEVGFTRQGVAFAAGDSYPTCIVTGGRGTIRVSHKGKEYWVCCTGCRDLFQDDPDAVLAEAAAKADKKP
jgi:YHS domain-containing protein